MPPMSPQMEHFTCMIDLARDGNASALVFVRDICRMAVNKAPDKDLLLIASAIIGVSPSFELVRPCDDRN